VICAPARALASLALLALPLAAGAGGFPQGAEPPSPVIGRVKPSAGSSAGGTRVTITGFNLWPDAVVDFGGARATDVVLVETGRLEVTAPPHRPGRVSVTVRNPDGRLGTRGWAFRYAAVDVAERAAAGR
jgi:hypothetical protein